MLDLRNMDCMDLMREYPDKHFDLAIVDPPYGIGIDGQKKDKREKGSGKYHASKWTRKMHVFKNWDKAPTFEYFSELFRVSKNQIIWGANYFPQFITPSKAWVIWYKGQNDLTMSDCEMAWSSFPKVTRQYECNRMALTQEGTIHPTQKPAKLYRWLLSNYAKPGDLILDTHLGSGSIAIACHDLGFDLVASELDADYFAAMQERISRHTAQGNLFKPQIEPEEDVRQDLSLFPAAKPSA